MTGWLALTVPTQPASFGPLAAIALPAFFLVILISAMRGR
jgi:hypothetical protein